MSEERENLLRQASEFINAGDFGEALERSRAILTTDPTNSDAKLIEAIALSQLGNKSDASVAFAEAAELSPDNSKILFNSAVHEFNNGDKELARKLATRSWELDPNHGGVQDLLGRLGPLPEKDVVYAREPASEFDPDAESLPFVRKMGAGWVAIGWILSIVSFCVFMYSFIQMASHVGEIMTAINAQDKAKVDRIMSGMSNIAITILAYLVLFLNLGWTIMDIIHRKGNFIWLLGHIPCTCLGLGFITQPLYIIFGRK